MLLSYSPEKLELLYKLAAERIARTTAAEDLRMLRVVRLAIASLFDKQGRAAAESAERRLEAKAAGKPDDQQTQALRMLARLAKR